jgi:hypothetical protein
MPQDSRHHQQRVPNTRQVKKLLEKQVGANSAGSTPQPIRRPSAVSSPKRVSKQPLKQKTRLKSWLTTLGAIALLLASSGVIVGGIWLSIMWMVNPNAVVWLNRFLPEWTRIPIDAKSPPKTLEGIQQEVRNSGFSPGEPLYLSKSGMDEGSTPFLLPILKSSPTCQIDCEEIIELRVYQPTKPKYYQPMIRLTVSGPEEYFVLSSLLKSGSDKASSSRLLPLKQLTRFDDKAPESGFWFLLSGQRSIGDTPMTYGQVLHYNPDQMHLSVMSQWTTPNENTPYWQQVTGDATPELVINQTVGLEPEFKVYQVRPRNFVPDPITLEEISLIQPVLDTQTYRNALLLARNGLWSPALQLLQSQKKNSNWSPAAQAQLDVIQLHTQITQAQAKQAWSSHSSSIVANLIDGRWADALLLFQSSVPGTQAQDIVTTFKTDSGGLLARVEAALKVTPNDTNVTAWGALILSAQQGRAKAIAWLQQRSKTPQSKPVDLAKINELLDRLDTVLATAFPTSRHPSRIIGNAQPVLNVNPADWLQSPEEGSGGIDTTSPTTGNLPTQPKSPLAKPTPAPVAKPPNLQLEPLQIWYQVQVASFHDGQQWRQAPFTNLTQGKSVNAKQLWNSLGLDTDSQIQISVWTPQGRQEATRATVKAVSVQNGVLQLLAAGDVLPTFTKTADAAMNTRLVAYTDSAIGWIEPMSVTLSDLNQMQPQWVSALLPALWRELAKSGQYKGSAQPNNAQLLKEMGQWSVRMVELTGNNKPDAVLTLYQDPFGGLNKPDATRPVGDSQLYQPRTIIFSDAGVPIYNEFSQDAGSSLTAIADLGDNGPAALVVSSKSNLSLKRWSSQNKRFE